jgi:transposase
VATFKICVFKHQQRRDGKYLVSIRVCWKRSYSYIRTEYYVVEKQINKKTFTLKDQYIINDLNKRILQYEELKAKKLGQRINMYKVKELADWFVTHTAQGTDSSIDFIAFGHSHIEKLKKEGRISYSSTLNRTVNSLIDF